MPKFEHGEMRLSQIPALQLLINLGYHYLTPEQALEERDGRLANVILENILREQLNKINRIHFKDREYPFSEGNIQDAVQKIKNVRYNGLRKTNAEIYDMLTLGVSLEQAIDGDSRSFPLNYIDWKTPSNNVFHVVPEYAVEREHVAQGAHDTETARPDIVLFVNGIPFVVIECKAPEIEVEQAISQNIRNQDDTYIPRLFTYSQMLLATNKNEAKYATVGTPAEFWSIWDELENTDEEISACVNQPLSAENKDALFAGEFARTRHDFDKLENEGPRLLTAQDKLIYSLCRPERLLEMTYGFNVFDHGNRKIARYQQFFVVRAALERIKLTDEKGIRKGGIVWHTQGSGKSITMVLLARALALDPELRGLRIILVTDRKDLDKQLGTTFAACGIEKKRATSGRNLAQHIKDKVGLITTLINKFDTALSACKVVDDSPDIIALVDESHRTNFGEMAARMRQVLPKACYIGFTGTPLLKKEKNSFARFGTLIEPSYSVRQAIADKAVVPLLYEGRHVNIDQNKRAVDLWFERHTEDLNEQQKADLKRKFSSYREISHTDGVVYMRALDISKHFRDNWQGTGFKAQIVTPDKATALKYHRALEEISMVSSEVVISAPDAREDYEEVGAGPNNEVTQFWQQMMRKHGNEEDYNRNIIGSFKESDTPEILIVVDRLITGFDAPLNTVLYLCRKLREHTLLQAIARVNRLHEGKDFGYIIDYANVLEELNDALTIYDALLSEYEKEDVANVLISINEQLSKLPQSHADLWDLFKEIKNSRDEEEYERLLAKDKLREDFYTRLTDYSKTLAIALSSEQFISQNSEDKIKRYKNDLRRFQKLRAAVQLRYAETIDYKKYEPRIKKLLNRYIDADTVTQLNTPVDIFDGKTFDQLKQQRGVFKGKSQAATADIIAYAVEHKISDNIERDPVFYEKFSKLIQAAIDDFKNQQISDLEYLERVSEIREKINNPDRDDVPDEINGDDEACAYFGAVKSCLTSADTELIRADEAAMKMAVSIKEEIKDNWKVDFWNDSGAQRNLRNTMDDLLYDQVEEVYGIKLIPKQMDQIIEKLLKLAKSWRPS